MPLESVITQDLPTFVTHLECSMTGQRYEADQVHGLSEVGRPLLVRYDLDGLGRAITKEALAARREGGFWRFREFLPVRKGENVVTLGEVTTPLATLPRIAGQLGLARGGDAGEIIVKEEGRLPTGSFKARGLALAVAMAKELGLTNLAMPTAGNAGSAMAAYASRAGLRSTVFCPDDAAEAMISEIEMQGATIYRVNGLINDCGKIVGDGKEAAGWFDCSTLKEPYRIEGKKTMGIELAEQLGWELPDVIFYPTGGGTGLIGMWKAFAELAAIGWIGDKRPRMVAVQSTGTIAGGMRVPIAVGDFLILRAVRESGGFAVAVPDEDILAARAEVAREEGLLLCLEGAATYAAYKGALADGRVGKDERVVLFNCGSGLKSEMPQVTRRLDRHSKIDYANL